MSESFKNKYRIPSARLQTWDYAGNGMYFITICTANRQCCFGNIVETQCIASPIASPDASLPDISLPASSSHVIEPEFKMDLNNLGEIAQTEWLKTKELRPDMNLELFEFVVMPNHFHGIVYIDDNQYNTAAYENRHRRDAIHGVSMLGVSMPDVSMYSAPTPIIKNQFGPQAKNLASVIRGFKSAVTTYARKNDILFEWQARYHDHIISTNKEYLRIADYIIDNPKNWNEDKFYTK
ncbi:MAG: transposase [Mucilaginibacter sp.]